MMKIVFSDHYSVDIGDHPWATGKYAAVVKRLKEHTPGPPFSILEAPVAEDEDVLRVHKVDHWKKLHSLGFTDEEERMLELPISQPLIDLFWRMAGGSVLATETALKEGLCVHIGGGLHHAFPGYGKGFCLINDIAVSVRSVIDRGLAQRAAIIDCDLHQGDGTAWIFRQDPHVSTLSIHQDRNFPGFKQKSTVDIALEDGVGDEPYLSFLAKGLDTIFHRHGPFDFVHYQAGADPYMGDSLGGLALSIEGLQKRDRMVLEQAASLGIPAVVTLGGGYAKSFSDLVQIHLNTVLTAIEICESYYSAGRGM